MIPKEVEELVKNKEVDLTSRYASLNKQHLIGDFKFVVMEKFLSYENTLDVYTKVILNMYFFMKKMTISEEKAFGLDKSDVIIEDVPLIVAPVEHLQLSRQFK